MNNRPSSKFLGGEGKRNRHNAALFHAMLLTAWGECDVIVGHHINFLFDKDLQTEDEIPAADTLLFDHDIMGYIFGEERAKWLMQVMATLKPYDREEFVCKTFNKVYPDRAVTLPPR